MARMAEDDYPEDDDTQHDAPGDAARARLRKTADAFRTISEVADELHVPQHVLRFWETKFPQVRPLKRGGGRRYYRPEDVLLLRRVADLLYTQGYTIKGVQRLLREGGGALHENIPPASAEEHQAAEAEHHAPAAAAPGPQPPALHIAPMLEVSAETEQPAAAEAAPDIAPEHAPAYEPEYEQEYEPGHEAAPDAEPQAEPQPAPAPAIQALPTDPSRTEAENERLRLLLIETLHALEELRRLIA